MYFSKNELKNLTEKDLNNLIVNKVIESKTIDYKLQYNLESDDGKIKFLANFSAFANAEGGNLIYGIKEKEGLPIEIVGINTENIDAEILKIESLLRDNIEPRIWGYEIKPVLLSNGKYVVVIFIPKSFNSPHVVNFGKHWRFYSRNSAGKYQLDVQELKSLFLASENVAEKIRNFRAERISRIINKELPIQMDDEPKFVLHIVPLVSFTQNIHFNLDNKMLNEIEKRIRELHNGKYTFEGYLFHNAYSKATKYIHIFRNGIIEIVNSEYSSENESEKFIHWKQYEEEFYQYTLSLTELLNLYGIFPPFILMNSIINIKGYKFNLPENNYRLLSNETIHENILLIPEILITQTDEITREFLRPIFDPLWNACGFPHSWNYNNEGKWVGEK